MEAVGETAARVSSGRTTGDATAQRVEWRGVGQAAAPMGRRTRMRVTARRASVYSVFVMEPGEAPVYHEFEALRPENQAW